MGIERISSFFQAGIVSNPTANFTQGKLPGLDLQFPPDDKPRVLRWHGYVTTSGPKRAQLEVWLGGSSGSTWERCNVALPTAGRLHVQGALVMLPTDPRRVQFRVRSYDAGADAQADTFRLDVLEVDGLAGFAYDWTQDHGTGSDTATTQVIQAGETVTVATAQLDLMEDALVRITPTIEIQPQSATGAKVFVYGDTHLLREVDVPSLGVNDHYPSISPMFTNQTEAGLSDWSLRVQAGPDAPCRIRRPGLMVADWDEVMA